MARNSKKAEVDAAVAAYKQKLLDRLDQPFRLLEKDAQEEDRKRLARKKVRGDRERREA